jgi:8-oxo-dGTP pyrophosphatase MutT (NUDIX family)
MRQQVGALPIRGTGDELRVLLVTSRETQRWIIPKGWRMRGRSNAEAAAQEAFEEAGVRGKVRTKPIGRYKYAKRLSGGVEDCKITTYLLEVTDELDAFPEMADRNRSWFTLDQAIEFADDEGLRDILRELEPKLQEMRAGERKAARKRAKAVDGTVSSAKRSRGKARPRDEPQVETAGPEADGGPTPSGDVALASPLTPEPGPADAVAGPDGDIPAVETPARKRRPGKAGGGKSASGKAGKAKVTAGKADKVKPTAGKADKMKAAAGKAGKMKVAAGKAGRAGAASAKAALRKAARKTLGTASPAASPQAAE